MTQQKCEKGHKGVTLATVKVGTPCAMRADKVRCGYQVIVREIDTDTILSNLKEISMVYENQRLVLSGFSSLCELLRYLPDTILLAQHLGGKAPKLSRFHSILLRTLLILRWSYARFMVVVVLVRCC